MLKEEITKEEYNSLKTLFKKLKHKELLPETFEEYLQLSDTEKMQCDYNHLLKLFSDFRKKHDKLPNIRFDLIDLKHLHFDLEKEIKIQEYLEEYGFFIKTKITDDHCYIEFKNKKFDVVCFLETNISFEVQEISLKHEDGEEYFEKVEYTFLDLENVDNRKHKHLTIIENGEEFSDIRKSQFKEVFEYINEFIYMDEDIEELEEINKKDISFRTLSQIQDIHFMEELIKNEII